MELIWDKEATGHYSSSRENRFIRTITKIGIFDIVKDVDENNEYYMDGYMIYLNKKLLTSECRMESAKKFVDEFIHEAECTTKEYVEIDNVLYFYDKQFKIPIRKTDKVRFRDKPKAYDFLGLKTTEKSTGLSRVIDSLKAIGFWD